MVEVLEQPATACRSLIDEARHEVERHKWIRSEDCGYDLGDEAKREWVAFYWPIFCRRKWLQYLQGQSRWTEFDQAQRRRFGAINRPIDEEDTVFRCLFRMAYLGEENLGMLQITMDLPFFPTERVIRILSVIDVNVSRLDPPADLMN